MTDISSALDVLHFSDICGKCMGPFDASDNIVKTKDKAFHVECFVCCQCFQPFENEIYYEFDGRMYCEVDFHILFAPKCNDCDQFILGRVIKAMNSSWHPACFRCTQCKRALVSQGFVKNPAGPLCHPCNQELKAATIANIICKKCRCVVEENQRIKYQSEYYHAYHFNCTNCDQELCSDAREKDGNLFCLRCHDKMGIPICGACRRPIEERVVHALGKTWHVEHFVCARCEKPFLGSRHYEKKGLAYCELHYQLLFGDHCNTCGQVISGQMVTAVNKHFCVEHFTCSACDKVMDPNVKFHELDLKPMCKGCFDQLPIELRRRIAKLHRMED